MNETKPWYQSKVVVLNIALLLFTFLVDINTELQSLGIPEIWALRATTIGNMGLRFLTIAGITIRSNN